MEERRKDYPAINERLAVLEVLQNKDIKDADDWRKLFCDKINRVMDKLSNLPCDSSQAWYQSMTRQVGFMWLVLGIVLVSLIGSLNVGASQRKDIQFSLNSIEKTVDKTNNQVTMNTKRLDRLEMK